MAAGTYDPAGSCWAATKLFSVSSEWPPGRLKLNKGIPGQAGAAACPARAFNLWEGLRQAGQGRGHRGEKGPAGVTTLLPYRQEDRGSQNLRAVQLDGRSHKEPATVAVFGQRSQGTEAERLPCLLLEPLEFFFTTSMNYLNNNDDR